MSFFFKAEHHCFDATCHNNSARFIGGNMILPFNKSTTPSIQTPFSLKFPICLSFTINKKTVPRSAAFLITRARICMYHKVLKYVCKYLPKMTKICKTYVKYFSIFLLKLWISMQFLSVYQNLSSTQHLEVQHPTAGPIHRC